MSRIQCNNDQCDRKFHLSQKKMEDYHKLRGFIKTSQSAIIKEHATQDFNQDTTRTIEEQELIDDVKESYLWNKKTRPQKEQKLRELKNQRANLEELVSERKDHIEWRRKNPDLVKELVDVYSDGDSEKFAEGMARMKREEERYESNVRELQEVNKEEKYLSTTLSDTEGMIVPDIVLSEVSDDDKELIRQALIEAFIDERNKPLPYKDPFPDLPGTHPVEEVCNRCGGTGQYHTYGVCYRCDGKGVEYTTTSHIRRIRKTDYNESVKAYQDYIQNVPRIVDENIKHQEKKELQLRGIDPERDAQIAKEKQIEEDMKRLNVLYPERTQLEPHKVTVKSAKSFKSTGYMGDTEWKTVFNFEDENGDNFVWFTTADPGIGTGDTCTIKGAIKRVSFNEYTDTPQVELSRVKASNIQHDDA